MLPKFFDAHTHANLAAFKDDYKEVVNRALSAGVGMVNVGTDGNTSLKAVEIAHEFKNDPVFAAVGLHPTDADEEGFDYERYKKLALDSKVVAIGECGLDYAAFDRKRSERLQKRALATPAEPASEFSGEKVEVIKNKQKQLFLEQMKLSNEVKKPLMVHCRNAFPDLIELLGKNREFLNEKPGIIHFFSGTKNEAGKLLDLGFYFTFGGVITFVRDYDEVIRFIPADRMLSETDAPFVTPVPYRGKRNEPAYVVEVVKKLAEIKNVPLDDIAGKILENTKVIFGIKTL